MRTGRHLLKSPSRSSSFPHIAANRSSSFAAPQSLTAITLPSCGHTDLPSSFSFISPELFMDKAPARGERSRSMELQAAELKIHSNNLQSQHVNSQGASIRHGPSRSQRLPL